MKKVLSTTVLLFIVLINGGFTQMDKAKDTEIIAIWQDVKGAKKMFLSAILSENRTLALSFHQTFPMLNIVVENIEGVVVYDETLEVNELSTLHISLETVPPGEYSLFLSNNECKFIGRFTLE